MVVHRVDIGWYSADSTMYGASIFTRKYRPPENTKNTRVFRATLSRKDGRLRFRPTASAIDE